MTDRRTLNEGILSGTFERGETTAFGQAEVLGFEVGHAIGLALEVIRRIGLGNEVESGHSRRGDAAISTVTVGPGQEVLRGVGAPDSTL